MFNSSLPAGKSIAWHQKESLDVRHYWWLWFLTLAAVSLVFSLNIASAPYLHSDEFMVMELGRIILEPGTNWSIAWVAGSGRPVLLWCYLGPVLQELSFQGIGQYGPRISGILGGFAAASVLVGWLLSRGLSRNLAFFLGLVFLLDPLLVQAYSMGRVDGWAMAFCLASCWIIRDTVAKGPENPVFRKRLLLAGSCAAIAFFIWPSAVFLFPLILVELAYLLRHLRTHGQGFNRTIMPLVLFGIGGILTSILLLLPIAPQLHTQFSKVIEGLKVNMQAGPDSKEIPFFQNSLELLRVLKFSPLLLLFTFVAALRWQHKWIVLASFTAAIAMVSTLVYINRVQYLLPYFIVLVAGLLQAWNAPHAAPFFRQLKTLGLLALLIWAAGLSLGIRTFLAFDAREERDRALVHQAAQSMIGPGKHAVYIPYEFYYAGRSLGWKMYRPYLAYNDPLSPEVLQQVLPYVDFVLMLQFHLTEEIEQSLKKGSMREQGVYSLYDGDQEPFNGITTHMLRLQNLYSIFHKPYGPYKLYVREKKAISSARISAAKEPSEDRF